MNNDEYVPSLETLLDHYEELSLTISRDPEIAKDNRRIAEKALARVRRDAAREALDGLILYADEKAREQRIAGNGDGGWNYLSVQNVAAHYRDRHYPEETP